MIKLSNSKLISVISKLLILLVIAKTLSLVLWWYLPSDGIEPILKNNYQPKYQRVYFKNMITTAAPVVKMVEKEISTNQGISITNMILKALYGTESKAFVIIAMKSTPKKTQIIGIGEVFKGYTLKSITSYSAIFEKDLKDYVLTLDKTVRPSDPKIKSKSNSSRASTRARFSGADSIVSVSRNDIAYFAKNPKQIWRDISIKELKDGKKILGFKVTKIKRKSKFSTLGLKKGDVIIKANNVKLESYKDALALYKNIGKLDAIQLVVLRDNQEMELVYDLN